MEVVFKCDLFKSSSLLGGSRKSKLTPALESCTTRGYYSQLVPCVHCYLQYRSVRVMADLRNEIWTKDSKTTNKHLFEENRVTVLY